MSNLPINRYHFNFKVETPLQLNFYSGSMLRGAFGHALRQVSCMTKMKDCKGCPLYNSCPYTCIFEPAPPKEHKLQTFSQVPAPYIIEPPALGNKHYQVGETLTFSMVLMGNAIDQLPLIIYAWQQAMNRGLGKYKSKASLINVSCQTEQNHKHIIYKNEPDAQVILHNTRQTEQNHSEQEINLTFTTPLRIQQKGKTLSNNMTARDFLMALIRRYYLLLELYGTAYQPPNFTELFKLSQSIDINTQFSWCDWTRYSNRQQQKMTLGGVLGKLTLTGNIKPFIDIIDKGQWFHIGNKTSFGMGYYQIITQDK